MHSPVLLDHFENPRNVGELPPPAVSVEVSNLVCGDILRISAQVENGAIIQTAFKSRGCTACLAAGSVLTELLIGRSSRDLKLIRVDDIDQALGGLINESKHVAVLAVDAVKALSQKLNTAASASSRPFPASPVEDGHS